MTAGRPGAGALWAGGALVAASAVLLCLIPKPEGDLFWALRTGEDILRSGRLPHADAYSWSHPGARWDVPEWGAFALYALAYRAGGLLGTWALMTGLAVATALVAWVRLARRVGAAWAFPLVSLMLLALSPCLQERPYAFTYLLLAVALVLVGRGRGGGPGRAGRPGAEPPGYSERTPFGAEEKPLSPEGGSFRGAVPFGAWPSGLLVLPALCVVWANLHQGVVVLPLLLGVYALGDALTRDWARAGRMGLAAGACALAALVSPYEWGLYRNVFVTLRDPALMAHITEWEPAWALPFSQSEPALLLGALAVLGLAGSRRRPRLPDALVLAALGGEALLHARNVALLAVGSVVILAPHWGDMVRRFGAVGTPPAQETPPARLGSPPPRSGEDGEIALPMPLLSSPVGGGGEPRRAGGVPNAGGVSLLLFVLAVLYVATVGLVALVGLRRAGLGRGGVGLGQAGLGAAVAELPRFPGRAAAFLDAGAGPRPRRLLNDLGDGGYLLWRLPREPVFIDGRLDVYAGRTFDDNLLLVRADGSPAWAALVRRYDFDAVLTASRREAAAFAALPGWRLVYADPPGTRPRHRLLVREDRNPHPALPLSEGGGFPEGRAATGGGSRRG